MNPHSSFLAIHFEVGGDSKSLEYQKTFWPAAVDLVDLANKYTIKLTLQFNPQWAVHILKNQRKLNRVKEWQKQGHEVGLHHHGYDHGDWNGYTNRPAKENDPKFLGQIRDMIELLRRLAHPYHLLSGTITDEEFDYPEGTRYDTEGIQIYHAKSKPKEVTLGGNDVIQVGMAFLPFSGDIERFKQEYIKTEEDEIFGVITHEKDFAENPKIIEAWFKFIKSKGSVVGTVSEIINNYQKQYIIKKSKTPLTFLKDVLGTTTFSDT